MNENPKTPGNGTWKALLLIALGAAIAIVITFGTAAWVHHCQVEKNHRQTALIAISDIDSFKNLLQRVQDEYFNVWKKDIEELRSLPRESILKCSEQELEKYWEALVVPLSLPHGTIAETYFTNAIGNWHDPADFRFIKKVGEGYSYIEEIKHNYQVMMDKKGVLSDDFETNHDWKRMSSGEKLIAFLQQKDLQHYLDDFCGGFCPYIDECLQDLQKTIDACLEISGISQEELSAATAN